MTDEMLLRVLIGCTIKYADIKDGDVVLTFTDNTRVTFAAVGGQTPSEMSVDFEIDEVPKIEAKCSICKREMDVEGDPSTADCGGDCLRCMAEAGDPDCIAAMEAANECQQ